MSDQDRELLELAAKAAGLTPFWSRLNGEVYLPPEQAGVRQGPWNSLEDDGDALRLAADLDINVEWFPRQRYVSAGRLGVGESIGWVDESGRRGALRRAITVAASMIGRAMP